MPLDRLTDAAGGVSFAPLLPGDVEIVSREVLFSGSAGWAPMLPPFLATQADGEHHA